MTFILRTADGIEVIHSSPEITEGSRYVIRAIRETSPRADGKIHQTFVKARKYEITSETRGTFPVYEEVQ